MRISAISLVLLTITLSACSGPAATQNTAIENGQLLATRQCSGCHSIGRSGTSPRPDAPLFRTILSRYRGDVLEEDLIQGIKVGHVEMPDFQLNPSAVNDLIVYLTSIQDRTTQSPRPATRINP